MITLEVGMVVKRCGHPIFAYIEQVGPVIQYRVIRDDVEHGTLSFGNATHKLVRHVFETSFEETKECKVVKLRML